MSACRRLLAISPEEEKAREARVKLTDAILKPDVRAEEDADAAAHVRPANMSSGPRRLMDGSVSTLARYSRRVRNASELETFLVGSPPRSAPAQHGFAEHCRRWIADRARIAMAARRGRAA